MVAVGILDEILSIGSIYMGDSNGPRCPPAKECGRSLLGPGMDGSPEINGREEEAAADEINHCCCIPLFMCMRL